MNNYETPMSHQSTVVQENDTSCDADMKMNLNP